MKYKITIIFFASMMVFPAFGQWDKPNESLSIAKFDIDWSEFNIPARDAEIIPFDDIHATCLLYTSPSPRDRG